MSEKGVHFDKAAVLERIEMPDLCSRLGIVLKQSGRVWWAPCPVHAERSASFKVEHREGAWKWHCFGCGVGGNAIDLWMAVTGLAFKEALAECAGFAGMHGSADVQNRVEKINSDARKHVPTPREEKVKPLPPLRKLGGEKVAALAAVRGLSVAGVQAAVDAGLIWGQMMGVSDEYWPGSGCYVVWGDRMEADGEKGRLRMNPEPCWLVSDGIQCAEARRLSGLPWRRHDGGEYKSHSFGTKKWPVGARLIGEKPLVALVEGGPDVLAAFHFLSQCGGAGVRECGGAEHGETSALPHFRTSAPSLENCAVVAVLGAAVNVPDEVWPWFEGKRVRMFPHFDKPDAKGRRTGWQAAEKWSEALTAAGAAVDCFYFGTDDPEVPVLLQADGKPVKDLNDAALGDEACLAAMAECWGTPWKGGRLTWEPWK